MPQAALSFPDIGRLVARIRERDPKHFAWINLFPTYANNDQLGNKGDTITAYTAHLRQFIEIVKPSLISYDNYQFYANSDGDQYFLNLAMIREESLKAGVPFLNIIQACSWSPDVRVPNPDELRFLTYTSLAYGAQGIAHYVYNYPHGHTGMIVGNDGKPGTGEYPSVGVAGQFAPEPVPVFSQALSAATRSNPSPGPPEQL